MAERLTGEAADKAREDMFRFQYEFLDMVLDGDPWILERGVDFPEAMDDHSFRSRFYAAAGYRSGNARVRRLDERRYQVIFIPRHPKDPVKQEQIKLPD